MKFNINEIVRVKMTDYGRNVYDAYACSHQDARIKKENENGWSEWQFWKLMAVFGPHMSLGEKNCFETTIELM